jgi:LPXTG-motif cell wall-anchored protein
VAFTAVKPAAPAPVADSTDVAAYLDTNGAYIQTQAEAGLPAGALNPATPVTATVFWGPGDSFVDVYAYSAPTFIGTFPVVAGAVSVTLSAEALAALGAGSHTLVAVGQTSGNVGAVSFEVSAALAATGTVVNPVAPIAAAGVLLLLGAALIVLRRRRANV